MKIKQTLCAALAALLIVSGALPVMAGDAITDGTGVMGDTAADSLTADVPPGKPENMANDEQSPDVPDNHTGDEQSPDAPDDETEPADREADMPQEPPAFSAHVEWSGGYGYLVRGTFTEFTSDIVKVQPMYSVDGDVYRLCPDIICWDLSMLDTEDPGQLQMLQNQMCLVSNMEPLKSYLSLTLDRFYLKLCITKENGASYETQAAVIDRGSPRPLPEGITAAPRFDGSIRVRTSGRPFRSYGKYQITVSEDAEPGEITAYLPDTVPVEVCLTDSRWNAYTEGVIDCPVTWNPLTLPQLTPGESVTIADAAEEITIPAGTLLYTPIGIFRLDEPPVFDDLYCTDNIDLVLNVVQGDTSPTGALSAEWDGLELSFDLKPTGAAAISVYTCVEGDAQWTKQPGLLSLDALNEQYSTANSGYAPVIDNDTEPYRSYLLQKESGNPAPFFVGVKIEGGVYDGKELILAWPDSYDLPLSLPELGGSGGNENNAGAGNEGDATGEGQRPNLPESPGETPETPSISSGSDTAEKPAAPDTTNPGQSDSQTPDTPKPGQSDPQAPNTPKPGQNDPQTPGTPKPGQSDAQSPGTKPKQPDPQKPDISKSGQPGNPKTPATSKSGQSGPQASGKTNTAAGQTNTVSTDPSENPEASTKISTADNLTADTTTDIKKNFTSNGNANVPTAKSPTKKTGESHSPAFPDLLSYNQRYQKEDIPLARSNRTETDAQSIRSSAEMPKRTGGAGNRRALLLPLIVAAALFGVIIAAANGKAAKR